MIKIQCPICYTPLTSTHNIDILISRSNITSCEKCNIQFSIQKSFSTPLERTNSLLKDNEFYLNLLRILNDHVESIFKSKLSSGFQLKVDEIKCTINKSLVISCLPELSLNVISYLFAHLTKEGLLIFDGRYYCIQPKLVKEKIKDLQEILNINQGKPASLSALKKNYKKSKQKEKI